MSARKKIHLASQLLLCCLISLVCSVIHVLLFVALIISLKVGDEYNGLLDGYGNRIEQTNGVTRGRWDNVRRDPVLHVSQDQDFVPDR